MIKRIPIMARWLLVTAVIAIVAGAAAWALFNARQDVPSTVTTEAAWVVTWTPAADLLTVANMAAGDVIYALATGDRVTAGTPSVDIFGAATDADGKGLRDALVLTIRDHLNNAVSCDAVNFALLGTEVYSGVVGAEPELALVTNGAMVPDPTDNQNYCFRMELPAGSNGGLAAATTDITIGFVTHD